MGHFNKFYQEGNYSQPVRNVEIQSFLHQICSTCQMTRASHKVFISNEQMKLTDLTKTIYFTYNTLELINKLKKTIYEGPWWSSGLTRQSYLIDQWVRAQGRGFKSSYFSRSFLSAKNGWTRTQPGFSEFKCEVDVLGGHADMYINACAACVRICMRRLS